MTEQKVLMVLERSAAQRSARKLPLLAPECAIADLGLDSLGLMETIGELEQEFGIVVPDEDLLRLRTVGDVTSCIERALSEQAGREVP